MENSDPYSNTICKQGILRKVKPKLKNKYFVLHRDGRDQLARLEYYDSVKNWESRKKPKKMIFLKSCFSVNAFANSKVEYGMALYTKDDCFQIAFENESDRESWLVHVIALYTAHRDSRPFFEHVWNVKIRERGLGKGYEGEYRLCLKDRNVLFFKKTSVDPTLNFALEVIRHCGHTDNFFKLEVGRQSSTGPGEFWLEVDDELIASNVHQTLMAVINAPKDEDMFRPQSTSLSSKERPSFSKSGSTNGGYVPRNERLRNGHSTRSAKSIQMNRNRSDSVDSKSNISALQPSVSSTSIPSGGLRSVEDISAAFSPAATAATNSLSSSLPDSRGSTPVRSLTPDLKPPRSTEPAANPSQSYLEMSPFAHTSNDRSNSISSCSVHSWTSSKDHQLADLSHGSSAVRGLQPFSAIDDGSYTDMGLAPQPLTSQTVAGRLSMSRRPERTQSYLSQTDGLSVAPLAIVDGDTYLAMAPSATEMGPAATDSYFEMGPAATDSYFEMSPAAAKSSPSVSPLAPDIVAADTYMDMLPVGASADVSTQPYMDMTPAGLALSSADDASADPYMDMAPASKSKDFMYVDMTRSPGSTPSNIGSGYLDMAPISGGTGKLGNAGDTSYVDMASGGAQNGRMSIALGGQALNPYIDMSGRDAHGSVQDGLKIGEGESMPQRHYSVGSRPAVVTRAAEKDQYVEMCRTQDMSAKSQSVPHLMPLSLASNPDLTHLQDEYPPSYPAKPEAMMMMSSDRPCTSNESLKQRPRGYTWSTNIRPRSSSHSQKHKLSTKSNSSRESLHSTCSDYIDMKVGARNRDSEYVEMGRSARHNRKHSHPIDSSKQLAAKLLSKLSPHKAMRSGGTSSALCSSAKSSSYDALSDKLNQPDYVGFMPDDAVKNPQLALIGRRMSHPHQRIDPFPELSNSSEEDVGMRSAASSFSSTRSNSSSRSSLARSDTASLKNSIMYGGGSQLDPDSYVECQQVSIRGSPASHLPSSGKQMKPARVTSFISEELLEPPKEERREKRAKGKKGEKSIRAEQTYVEMNPPSSATQTYVEMSLSTNTTAKPNHKPSQSPLPSQPLPIPPKSHQLQSLKPLTSPTQPFKVQSAQPRSRQQTRSPSQPLVVHTSSHHHYDLPKPPPLNQSLPLPSQQADSYTMMGPQAVDPYCMMEVRDTLAPAHSDEKFGGLKVDLSDANSAIASSDVVPLSASTGTGSSGDSNHTLQHEEFTGDEHRHPLPDPPFSSKQQRTPKPAPCYIRQNSGTFKIYPSPAVPAACYIRSDSVLSTNSEFDIVSSVNSSETQDAILNSLSLNQSEDLSNMMRRDALSPERHPSSASDGSTVLSYSRSNSDSSEIPCSAAELERQQKKKLELVQEEKESCGSKEGSAESYIGSKEGSASSGKDIGAQLPVKSYIREDPKPARTRSKGSSAPTPALPIRGISIDEKAIRLSAGGECVEMGPLNYVDIKHENAPVSAACATANSSSSPKTVDSAVVAVLASVSDVNYTTIDHERTMELSKKGVSGGAPH